MALAVRTNGSLSINLINATWFNDIRDLLVGNMTDQPVKIVSSVTSQAIGAAPGAPTAAIQASGSVDVGAHTYAVTFVATDGGETKPGTTVVATTTVGNQTVALSIIPTGPTGTTARKIYRSKAGTTSPLFLVTTLNDNTTTVYSDTATDASLSATQAPIHPSFGGTLVVKDSTSTIKAQIFNDGAVSFDGGGITSDGNNNLTVNGTLNIGAGVSGFKSLLAYSTINHENEYWTPQSGVANGHLFIIWNGSGQVNLFGIGSTGIPALAYVDNSGNIATGALLLSGGPSGTLGKIDFESPQIVFRPPESGATPFGFVFQTWTGSASANAFSVGGQFAGALSWVDNSGNLVTTANVLYGTGVNGSRSFLTYSTINHENEYWTPQSGGTAIGHLFVTWNGSAQVTPFSIGATGVVGTSGVDTSGNFFGPVNCSIPTTRNGVALSVPIFTGTNTPVNPPTGSIWIKA